MGKTKYRIIIRKRIRRRKFKFKFVYTRRQLERQFFGKEMVKFFCKNFTGKKDFMVPNPVLDESSFRSNLFERLARKQRYYIHLMAAMLFVFIGIDFINAAVLINDRSHREKQLKTSAVLDGKTITGYVVDENNKPWNNQLTSIMIGDSTIATNTIKNGQFKLTDIV